MADTPLMADETASEAASDEARRGSFDIFELVIYGLGRYRWWILPCAVIGLAVGLVMSLIKPNMFSSAGQIFVKFGMRESISPEFSLQGGGSSGSRGIGLLTLQDELQILKSQELFENIARAVGPDRLLERFEPTRYDTPETPLWKRKLHEFQDWYFNRGRPRMALLAAGDAASADAGDAASTDAGDAASDAKLEAATKIAALSVSFKTAGSILTISARAKTPEVARDLVAAALNAVRERHRDVFAAQFKETFVDEQLEAATEEEKQAVTEYYQHRKDCGFFEIQTQKTQLISELTDIDKKFEETSMRLKEIEAERKSTEELIQTLPEKVEQPIEEQFQPNPVVERFTNEILNLKMNIAKLPVLFIEGSEQYLKTKEALETEIRLREEELAEQPALIVVKEATSIEVINPELRLAANKLRELDLEQEKILLNQERATERRDLVMKKLDALLLCEPIHHDLQGEIGKFMSRVGAFRSTRDKAEAMALVDQDLDMSNLRVIEPASFNRQKATPRRAKTVLTGLVGGIAAWGAFALLRQLLDSKVRFPKNIERTLGVKVLGVIPEDRHWKRLGKRLQAKLAA